MGEPLAVSPMVADAPGARVPFHPASLMVTVPVDPPTSEEFQTEVSVFEVSIFNCQPLMLVVPVFVILMSALNPPIQDDVTV